MFKLEKKKLRHHDSLVTIPLGKGKKWSKLPLEKKTKYNGQHTQN
jgi:hypothetical protein